jgi:hypothetical protein
MRRRRTKVRRLFPWHRGEQKPNPCLLDVAPGELFGEPSKELQCGKRRNGQTTVKPVGPVLPVQIGVIRVVIRLDGSDLTPLQ